MGLALCLVAAACSGGSEADEDAAALSIDIATATVDGPVSFPTDGQVIVPPGTTGLRWIERSDDQFCVATVEGSDLTRECFPWDDSIDVNSFSWSPDNSLLYFTPDFIRRFDEPDIWSYEAATGALNNLTDDGTDDASDERAVFDVAPFVSAVGTPYFFSLDANFGDPELSSLEEDGSVRSIPGVALTRGTPVGPLHPVGNDRFVFQSFIGPGGAPLIVLDLEAGQAAEIELPLFDLPIVLGSGSGAAVVADNEAIQRFEDIELELVDFDTDGGAVDVERLDLGLPEPFVPPVIGFSPDGSAMVAAVATEDDAHRLVGAQRDESGRFGDPVEIAPPGFLGTDDDGRPVFPRTFGSLPVLVWTDDNQLMIPTGDGVLVLELLGE